jgi:hypothetical protein
MESSLVLTDLLTSHEPPLIEDEHENEDEDEDEMKVEEEARRFMGRAGQS